MEELEELRSKYIAEREKYSTRVTRKACLAIGVFSFVVGFLVKAMIF